jgi:hypothetical protein
MISRPNALKKPLTAGLTIPFILDTRFHWVLKLHIDFTAGEKRTARKKSNCLK